MGRSRRADTGHPAVPGRVPDDPAVRLPGAGARAVRPGRFTAIVAAIAYAVPIATKLVADGIRGVSPTTVEAARSIGQHPLADDHQGPAADGARGAGARDQPGPALRAVDGRHRRPGRRRQPRLHRGLGLHPGPAVRQGSGGRHRHHGARRDARPDRPVRRGALRHGERRLPPRPVAERARRERQHMARRLRRTPAGHALAARRGLGLAACGGGDIKDDRQPRRRWQGLRRPNIAVNPWTGYVANAHVIGYVAKERARLQRRPTRTSRRRSAGRAWPTAPSTPSSRTGATRTWSRSTSTSRRPSRTPG